MDRTTTKSSVVSSERGTRGDPGQGDRLLALEIRPQRSGFVVLEGTTQLLDWGTRMFANALDGGDTFNGKLDALLQAYTPTTVVVRRRDRVVKSAVAMVNEITDTIRMEARRHSINFESVTARTVHRFFAHYGCRTKYEIASTLAQWFEELSWKLPPKRKPWQNEHSAMVVFDALATAMTLRGVG
jgi:hypothetical protein